MSTAVRHKGLILTIVMAIIVILSLTAAVMLSMAGQESVLSRIEADKTKAFYLAEAGIGKMKEELTQQQMTYGRIQNDIIIIEGSLESGDYYAKIDFSQNPCFVISTGRTKNIKKSIQAKPIFLAFPLEQAIYANNNSGMDWSLQLRGSGNPVPYGFIPGSERGGRDIVNGNIFIDGDVYLFEESSVNAAPLPNTYNLSGDIEATGNISIQDSAKIAGKTMPKSKEKDLVDLKGMNYAVNNTHNVTQIFENEGVAAGYLPSGNILHNVFVKNPSDRFAECKITTGNDYFFEPSTGFVKGSPKTGDTPLDAGENRVYYVDGNVWIHSYPTYGFKMKGKITIVATGDIHVCDNLQYKDKNSILGLVALGKYDEGGKLISGGNIRFGDAVYGNMSTFSAIMFAANDFAFNTDQITKRAAEPDSGFTVNGCFTAMGKVSIERDWYDKRVGATTEKKTARYDPKTKKWVNSETSVPLSQTEIGTLRHYQMQINYDDRVRNPETQPPGLPKGGKKIFAGFTEWDEEFEADNTSEK